MKINSVHRLVFLFITRFILSAVCVVFFQTVPVSAATVPDTIITNQSEIEIVSGQPLAVKANISDSTGVVSSRCYIRYDTASDFVYLELSKIQDILYQGYIPVPAEDVTALEYFFLVVNGKSQVVRSPLYTMGIAPSSGSMPRTTVPAQTINLKSELSGIDSEVVSSFARPDNVQLVQAHETERFGLAGGLYTADNFSEHIVTEGFFGGFALDDQGGVQAVQGIILDIDQNNPSVQRIDTGLVLSGPLLQDDETDDIVGPDIRGEDWSGWFWMQDSTGGRYFLTPVTAVITQVGSEITLTMDFDPPIVIGDYYWGSIDPNGNIQVYDDNFQTWTSYFGPATETAVTIADFVGDVADPKADLYVFELTREPEPPPPPEPNPVSFLPAIYKILFP